jgi:photoactive yellow protein
MRDPDIFELSREALDELPVGALVLDRSGIILRYNRAEATLAGRVPNQTIGLSFFNDIAPCANVEAFRGRFDAFARETDSGVERFTFSFAFRWGREDVAITLLRKAGHAEITLLVRARSVAETGLPAEGDARVEPRQPASAAPRETAAPELVRPVVSWLDAADGFALDGRVHPDDLERVRAVVAAAARARTAYAVEYRGPSDAGQRAFAEHGYFGPDPLLPSYATILEITEQRRSDARMRYAANYDPLTGLPNQRLLGLRVADAISQADSSRRSAALIILNIDSFRGINETFGHDVGDDVLRGVGLRLGAYVRAGDTVARVTSDSFAVLVTDLDSLQSARETATRLIAAVAQPFVIRGHTYDVTCRAGISLAPADGRDSLRLLRAAEMAVHAARVAGYQGLRFYSRELASEAAQRFKRQNELREAIANGEFQLLYQPQVDVVRDRVVGVEALIRWNHPTRGIISPLDFIPLADRTGLIVPLGEWVLRTACRQGRAWSDSGYDVRMCVNVSAVQFGRADFVALVAAIVAEFGVKPGRLELELTETIFVAGFGEILKALAQLKALGVRLAIDDFGTGYSSLSYLKYLPVDTLKIDRAFVTNIVSDQFDLAIATAIYTLTEKLKLECVVEGVEDAQQLQTLRGIGCAVVQGFYFCRPTTPEKVGEMFARSLTPAGGVAPGQ